MSEANTTPQSRVPTPQEIAQAKAILQAHNETRIKKPRKAKPVLTPIGETVTVTYQATITKSNKEFTRLKNGKVFVLDQGGALLFAKKSKDSAISLMSGTPLPLADAAVYEVLSISRVSTSGE